MACVAGEGIDASPVRQHQAVAERICEHMSPWARRDRRHPHGRSIGREAERWFLTLSHWRADLPLQRHERSKPVLRDRLHGEAASCGTGRCGHVRAVAGVERDLAAFTGRELHLDAEGRGRVEGGKQSFVSNVPHAALGEAVGLAK